MLHALDRSGALTGADIERALADEQPEVRCVAAELAARTEDPSLLGALDDPNSAVVEVACWALGERERPDPGAVAKLAAIAVGHEDALCRESAIAALGAIGDPQGLTAVLAGLSDKPAVRRRAVVALAAFDGPEVDSALDEARHDRDRQVRDTVEELLGPVSGDGRSP